MGKRNTQQKVSEKRKSFRELKRKSPKTEHCFKKYWYNHSIFSHVSKLDFWQENNTKVLLSCQKSNLLLLPYSTLFIENSFKVGWVKKWQKMWIISDLWSLLQLVEVSSWKNLKMYGSVTVEKCKLKLEQTPFLTDWIHLFENLITMTLKILLKFYFTKITIFIM